MGRKTWRRQQPNRIPSPSLSSRHPKSGTSFNMVTVLCESIWIYSSRWCQLWKPMKCIFTQKRRELSNIQFDYFSSSLIDLVWIRVPTPLFDKAEDYSPWTDLWWKLSAPGRSSHDLRRFFSCGRCLPLGSAHLMSYPTAPWWLRVFMQPSDPYVGHYNSVAGISKARPDWRVKGCKDKVKSAAWSYTSEIFPQYNDQDVFNARNQ